MTSIHEYLAEQKRLAEAADEGPWFHHETVHADNYVTAGGGILTGTHVCGPTYEKANAEFIAAARESVPRMIAALEAVVRMHFPYRGPGDRDTCGSEICSNLSWGPEPWPCPTIRSVEAALGGDGDE